MEDAVEHAVSNPVDVRAARAWLLAHAVEGVDRVTAEAGGTTVTRRVGTARGSVELAVVLAAGATPVLRVGGPGTEEAVEVGRRWLGVDLDVASGVAALGTDPVLGPLVASRPHVRVPGAPDPFEAAVGIIVGQHVSLVAGRVFAARLAARGAAVRDLARADPAAVRREVGVTGGRARSLVALARAVEGGLDLGPQPDPIARAEVRAGLLALPGVGPWTADLVAMRCLRDPDVFLPGDLVLRKALGGVPAAEAARLAEAWRPYRSLAVVHLWTRHALDPPR
ncbi:DNA-3-methyladenine glycosylase 2 [Phycicoccus sp. CSK15P-2]|uniref:DNA-3-methyladenine glycosylase 2 n=1 Tax=Phycicoccus sp. CSK15P-2 TaxID=2807627 RepID=UPI00194F57D1|nr:AlkA N-terminal domain-containing protein [Phycicoccus sp. CSK15P-2]MBM6403598.1 DNA-3-methyladenine glycosylase 2 [Phycicoccus sp. CSK15P-2]MBM6405063.1 DNA-3-methyladenine glycosylase 2 [Phycicoccus sp. CSK15P-2]